MPLRRSFRLLGVFGVFGVGVLLLSTSAWLAACDVAPFDPRGFRCETDLHCLPDYFCDKDKLICQLSSNKETTSEPTTEPASDAAPAERAAPEPRPEPRPEPAPRELPQEPSPETPTPDTKPAER